MGIDRFNFSHFFDNKIQASINKESYKIKSQKLAIPIQKHTSNVKFVTKPGLYDNVDGLITSKQYNVILTIKVADCVPIYIYDPNTCYYALIHSGWKGTKDHIIKNAIELLFSIAGSDPKDIIVVIGPHIRNCCYEIDWDVAQYFSFINKDSIKNKWLLSLEKEIIYDAKGLGVLNYNIHTSDICTYESLDCESFRRDGKKSKRMIGIIG
tara:strand:+ start:648 stop:1277 length:630 start_codon:yes stop_codon:yes gene_type:complete